MRRVLVLALLLPACDDNLPLASFVDKLRVLAIQASPAEVQPGEPTRLSPLVAQPRGATSPSALWLTCRVDPGATTTLPCGIGELDGSALPPACPAQPKGDTCTLDDRLFTVVTPSPSLVGADGTGQLLVTLIVADDDAQSCYLDTLKNAGLPTEPDHCVIAYKRVSVATLPANHNPTLADFSLTDATPTPSLLSGTARVAPSPDARHLVEHVLSATRDADAAEMESDGTYESLSLSWFTDDGAIDGGRSTFDQTKCDSQSACAKLEPFATETTKWKAPVASGPVRFWAVLRDDRGGVGWRSGELTVAP